MMRHIVTRGLGWLFVAPASLGAVKAEETVVSPAPVNLGQIAWGGPSPAGEGAPIYPDAVAVSAARELVFAASPWWSWVGQTIADAGVVALAAAAVGAIWRQRRKREQRLLTLYEVPETSGEKTRALAPLGEPKAPRVLPFNPYLDPSGPRRLFRQIENAAEASLEFHRVFGLIFFDLGDPPAYEDAQAELDWTRSVSELVDRLQGALRPTDYVVFVNEREIIACIALLPGMTELIGISERLRRVGREAPAFAPAFSREAGLSIFPLCGYGGEELIAHARGEYFARNFPDAPRPRLVGPILENAAAPQG